jgi:hypothetical protein
VCASGRAKACFACPPGHKGPGQPGEPFSDRRGACRAKSCCMNQAKLNHSPEILHSALVALAEGRTEEAKRILTPPAPAPGPVAWEEYNEAEAAVTACHEALAAAIDRRSAALAHIESLHSAHKGPLAMGKQWVSIVTRGKMKFIRRLG